MPAHVLLCLYVNHGTLQCSALAGFVDEKLKYSPQSFLFNLRSHPLMPEYRQCTTIGTFDSAQMEFLYFLFVMVMSFILPFIIMLYSYVVIVCVISRSV